MKVFDRKYIELVRELAVFNFKFKDQGTVLGFLWTLVHPFLMLVILYMLFSKRLGRGIEHYEIYLLIGIIQWNFLNNGTSEGLKSLMDNRLILRNIYLPRTSIVVSSVLGVFIPFVLELLVLSGLVVFSGVGLSTALFVLPLVIFMQLILITGISLVLSCLNVYFRDMGHIWNIILKIGFFITPVFYSIPMFISKAKMTAYFLNPMTQLMIFMRQIILYKEIPPVRNMVLVLFAVLVIFAGCYWVFKMMEDDIVERL